MFKRFRKPITKKQTLSFVFLLSSMKRLLAVLGVIGMLWSYVPWNQIQAHTVDQNENTVSEDVSEIINSDIYYESLDIDPSLVPISHEIINERSETTKTFRKIDGTYETVIYNDVIHFQEDGEWKQINNSLFDNGADFENTFNKFKLKFPKKLDDNKQIKLSMDGYSIDWSILNISSSDISFDDTEITPNNIKELVNINQSLQYSNVQPNVDIEYIIMGSKIKENIILNQYVENFTMTFEYKLKDLSLIEDDSGNVVFLNDDNEVIFVMNDFVMNDASESFSEEIAFELIETGNKTYQLKITPSDKWLKNAQYPVYIDPSIESGTTTFTIYDTYISESAIDTNFSNSTYMPVSNTYSTSEYRALLYFYIPSNLMDKVITYSNLTLTKSSQTIGRQINIYQNDETFSNDYVTWRNAPTFDSRVIDYHVITTDSEYDFDITRSVKEWQETGNTRTTGFTITDDEGYGAYNSVKQNHTDNSSLIRPTITIGYEEPSGLKDYWTYTSQNIGMVGTGYISDYTGNLTWVRNEYSVNNDYMSLTLSFFHNNNTRTENIGYGDGWRTNYNVQILNDEDIDIYYMLKPDANKVYFMNEECVTIYSGAQKCTSIAEDGSRMILERFTYLGNDSNMKIMTIADLDYNFNGDGGLTNIRNSKTNHYLIVYYVDTTSQLIDYVVDEAENRIEFTYNSGMLSNTELQLKQLDNSLRGVEKNNYYYDTFNNLNYIDRGYRYGTDTNTSWSSYERLEYSFDSSNKLLAAYNATDDYMIEYGYNVQNKVNNVVTTDSGLNIGSLDIIYELGKTTYTDFENDSIYYLFDNYGHTVNVIDDYGNAAFYKYSGLFENIQGLGESDNDFSIIDAEPNYINNHNLIESSDVMKQQHNPIVNHGFELGTWGWTLNEVSGGIIDRDPDYSNIGGQSLYITSTSSTSYSYATQSIYLETGSYTASVWINNPGSGVGAYIDIEGEYPYASVTEVISSDGWVKNQISFYIDQPRYITIRLLNQSISTAHFDNVQVVEGYTETNCNDDILESCADYINTRYNVVTNSSFESGNTGWILNDASFTYINETGITQDILGEKAMRIVGDGSTEKSAFQSLGNLNTSQETFIIAAWAKADAVPNKTYLTGYDINEPYGKSDGRFFGILFTYWSPNEMLEYSYYLSFNPDIEYWQYQMMTIDMPSNAMNMSISAVYQGEGTAYFDNIQFYHDKLSTEYSYNSSTGDLEVISDATSTTEYVYDSEHNVISFTKDDIITDIVRSNTYLVEEVSRNNVRTTFVYDSSTNQLVETYIGYDQNASSQEKWFKTSTTHTIDGQYVDSVTDEFGNTSTSNIDYSVGIISDIMDALGNSQEFVYDEYGNLISTTTTDYETSNTISSSYEYDSSGRLWKINRDGYFYEFHYNNLDQVISVDIAGTEVMTYDYWEEVEGTTVYYTDLLKKQTYGNNDYVEFEYNLFNQIKTVSFNGNIRYNYEYDSSGRLSVFKDIHNNNIYFYSYDLAGRIEAVTDKDSNVIAYTYDSVGNLNGYEYTVGAINRGIEYHYNLDTGEYDYTQYDIGSMIVTKDYDYDSDSLKRLNTVELVFGTNVFTKVINYDDNNVDSSMGNATNRIGSIKYINNGNKSYHYYTYDENHNIIEIEIRDSNNWIIDKYNYYYDGFNQLVREDIFLDEGQYKRTFTYEYDNQGNITYIKEYVHTTSSTVTTPLLGRKEFYYTSIWGDQLSKYELYEGSVLVNEIEYDYDNSGNPVYELDSISGASVEYEWEGRQLTGYSTAQGGLTYKYNDQGIRTKKGSHTYVLEGDKVIVETRGTTVTIYYSYDVDGSLLSMNYNGNEYFYITNLQGDVIELVDINGNNVAKYKYDAWGNILYSSGSMSDINPYRYRGYRFDDDTGLYYLQTRYYNPEIGRYINAKSVESSMTTNVTGTNVYIYALNSPVVISIKNEYYSQMIGHRNAAYFVSSNAINSIIGDNVNMITTVENTLSSNNIKIFSALFRQSSGWSSSPRMISSFIGRIGFSSYTTTTKGETGLLYVFAGETTDMTNVFGSTYYAGLGVNAWDIVGVEAQLESIGLSFSMSVGNYGMSWDLNLIGSTSITLSKTESIGLGVSETSGYTGSINTGLLGYTIYFVYKVYMTGEASWEYQPAY